MGVGNQIERRSAETAPSEGIMQKAAPSSFTLEEDDDIPHQLTRSPNFDHAQNVFPESDLNKDKLTQSCSSLADALLLIQLNRHAIDEMQLRLQVCQAQLTNVVTLICHARMADIGQAACVQELLTTGTSLAQTRLCLEQEAVIECMETAGLLAYESPATNSFRICLNLVAQATCLDVIICGGPLLPSSCIVVACIGGFSAVPWAVGHPLSLMGSPQPYPTTSLLKSEGGEISIGLRTWPDWRIGEISLHTNIAVWSVNHDDCTFSVAPVQASHHINSSCACHQLHGALSSIF